MTDPLLRRGAEWLSGKLKAYVGIAVIYARGSQSVSLVATLGNTRFMLSDGLGGTFIENGERDFLVAAADLALDDVQIVPAKGDTITMTQAGEEQTWEVLAPAGEPVWRWSDAHRITRRIHAKLTEGAD